MKNKRKNILPPKAPATRGDKTKRGNDVEQHVRAEGGRGARSEKKKKKKNQEEEEEPRRRRTKKKKKKDNQDRRK